MLQTAYPEARRVLDYDRLGAQAFCTGRHYSHRWKISSVLPIPGAIPENCGSTLSAPIGTMADRLRMIRLALNVRRGTPSRIFQKQDMPTMEFLRSKGFSEKIIQRFFKPFFAGVCLDPEINASSRVFQYIFRIFAEGDVVLPGEGMAAIAAQLMDDLPPDRIRTGVRVESIHQGGVELTSGEKINRTSCGIGYRRA